PSRSLEEVQHRLVLPRGRVRHVHDDPCACERFGQPLTSDGVDAGGGGSRHNLVPALAKELHELLPDEPAATNHYDLHVASPCWSPRKEKGTFIFVDERPLWRYRGDWIRTSDLLNPIQGASRVDCSENAALSCVTAF